MLVAICLSNNSLTKNGFKTEKDAEEYIESNLCKVCKEDLKNGFIDIDEIEKVTVEDVFDTQCGSEWVIERQEDYQQCESIKDILNKGMSFKKIDMD